MESFKGKKITAAAMFVAIMVGGTIAQDIIYLRNGSEIKAKVTKSLNIGNVEFLSSSGQNSYISVMELEKIQYADGHRVNYVCKGCVTANKGVQPLTSSNSVTQSFSTQEQEQLTLEPAAQSEAALDGADDWDGKVMSDDEISEIVRYFTPGTKEYSERQKRLAKMDKTLANMKTAGLIMGAFDIFGGGTGTIGGAAAAAAAYGFLNVTRKGVDEINRAIETAGGWETVKSSATGGVTKLSGRCDDRKKEISAIRRTTAKQAALAAGVSAGIALAAKNAVETKNMGDIKYTVMATRAITVAVPELKLQNRVVKLARQSVESCKD